MTQSQEMAQTRNTRKIRGVEADMGTMRERFGGADLVAAVLGMFAAVGVLVLLGALIAAGEAGIDYQLNAIDIDGNLATVEVVGAIVAGAVLFASFFAGGWTTGRMARYDGGANGLGAALLFVLLAAVFGAAGLWFGSEYNAFSAAGLPDWFSQFDAQDLTLKAAAAAALGIVATLLGGYLGGRFGELYHRDADAALVQQATTGNGS